MDRCGDARISVLGLYKTEVNHSSSLPPFLVPLKPRTIKIPKSAAAEPSLHRRRRSRLQASLLRNTPPPYSFPSPPPFPPGLRGAEIQEIHPDGCGDMSRNHDDYVEEVEDMDEVENHGPVVMGFNSDEDEDDEHAQANDKGSDTSSTEARCGKDIQGISWDRLAITREKYRQTRLEQYKNYENIPYSGEAAMKVCKSTEKGGTYYEFRRNTRSVKSTILHFQAKGNDHIRASRGDQNPQRVAHPSSPLLMDRAPAAGAGEDPSPATAESSSSSGQQEDSQWLATLSEPELDLLISLKMLAVTRAKTVGHPHLAHLFDLRTLRALGVVLLESFKERLKETSVDPSILDRFAPLSDSGADFINSGSDSEVVKPNKDQSTPNIVKKKRKQM